MAPLVSIVTPTLDAARFLPECLASVRAQDHPRIEHIVVDGGSTDGTVEIARAAPGVRVECGRDAGMYDAINRGFSLATGQFLAYQNADDRYADAGAVSAAVARLESPDVDVVYGDYRLIDEGGAVRGTRRAPEFDASLLRRHSYVPPHSTFVRAALVRERGLQLDGALRFAGDWEWFVRLSGAGARFAHLPRVISDFRVHGSSISATIGWGPRLREWRAICARHGLSLPILLWTEAFWIPGRRRLQGLWRVDAPQPR